MSLPVGVALTATFKFYKAGTLTDPSVLPTAVTASLYPDGTAGPTAALTHASTGVFTATAFTSGQNTLVGTYEAWVYVSDATLDSQYAQVVWIDVGINNVTAIANGAITAATFAANALDAVWSTAVRTLTSLAGNDSDLAAGVLNAVAASYNTANSIGAKINSGGGGNVTLAAAQPNYAPLKASDYTAPLSSLQTAQAVLNAVQASYNTPGTIGYLIGQIAGGGGDQWLTNLIAGGYSYPEAGAILIEILSKVLPIGNGVQFTNAPVDEDGATRIVLGNSYMATDGIPLDYTLGAPSALDPAGIPQWHYWGARGAAAINGTVTGAALKKVRFELTPAQSAALTGTVFSISATLTSGDVYRTPDLPLILVGSVPNRVTP